MSGSDEQTDGVDLAQVRERFVSAERELQEAVSALRALEAASGQLAEARTSFTESASTLSALEGRLASATETLLSGASNLRSAIEAIDRSDPARLRAELEVRNAALLKDLSTMQQTLLEASLQTKGEVASSLASLKQDITASETNEIAAITAGGEQVVSLLQAALRAQGNSIADSLRTHSQATAESLQRAGAAREAARREGRLLAIVGAVLAAGALISVWLAR